MGKPFIAVLTPQQGGYELWLVHKLPDGTIAPVLNTDPLRMPAEWKDAYEFGLRHPGRLNNTPPGDWQPCPRCTTPDYCTNELRGCDASEALESGIEPLSGSTLTTDADWLNGCRDWNRDRPRLRALTPGEVAEVKSGADRSDEVFALNVLRKFCRMHGIVLTDWDGNDASGVPVSINVREEVGAEFERRANGVPPIDQTDLKGGA